MTGSEGKKTLGVISDTHGLLRPEAVAALRGCDLLIHAGDVGKPEVLCELRELAPLVAVRGNVDVGAWAESLPKTEVVEIDEQLLYVLHDLGRLDLDPVAASIRVVISGHSHQPAVEERDGVLYLNPGSAGPRRFDLPISLARLELDDGEVRAELVPLEK